MQLSPHKVFVHIVTYNNEDTINTCIESVITQNKFTLWEDLFICVTDNDSKDETVKIIEEKFKDKVRLKLSPVNFGFSLAHNEGIKHALAYGASFILVLNPDVKLAPNALSLLVESLKEDSRAGVAFPKLYRADDDLAPVLPKRFDSTGMFFTPAIRHFDRGSEEHDEEQYEQDEYCIGGTGACILLKKDFILDASLQPEPDIQVFDENFFVYREDADLAWRSLILGWKGRYVKDAIGYHKRVVTPEKRTSLPPELNYHSVRNRFLLQFNNFKLPANLRCSLPTLWRNILVLGAVLFKEKTSRGAVLEAFSLFPIALEQNKKLHERKRLPDYLIAPWFSYTPHAEPVLVKTPAKNKIQSLLLIIVNYNSGNRLENQLGSLDKELARLNKALPTKLIVCDNHSQDKSAEKIKDTFSNQNIEFFLSEKNLGFGPAINRVASQNSADAFLILNPDIHTNAEDILQLVSDLDTYDSLAAAAPVLVNENRKPQSDFTIRNFPTMGSTLAELFFLHKLWPGNPWTSRYLAGRNPFIRNYLTRKTPKEHAPHENQNAPLLAEQPAGACLLIRQTAFKHVGGFDEIFFPAWFEDVDLCKRFADEGFVCAIDSRATAVHEGGYSKHVISSARFANIWYTNLLAYWKKHGSKGEYFTIRMLLPAALFLRSFFFFLDAFVPKDIESVPNRLRLSKALLKLGIKLLKF